MAFTTKKLVVNNEEKNASELNKRTLFDIESKESTPESDDNRLTQQELIFLLECIKKSTFLGEHIEMVYVTATKLQNQYLDITKTGN
jgi:hypothetical protein